jgi:hypothetical protein
VTWCFAGRCANRLASAVLTALIWLNPGRQHADQQILARQPRAKTAVRRHGWTGSCDDPEVLAFLDDTGADHGYLSCSALIERVQAHLILDRVNQFAES